MDTTTKKLTLAALKTLDEWIDGKISIRKTLHAQTVTYMQRANQWLDEALPEEKKP